MNGSLGWVFRASINRRRDHAWVAVMYLVRSSPALLGTSLVFLFVVCFSARLTMAEAVSGFEVEY